MEKVCERGPFHNKDHKASLATLKELRDNHANERKSSSFVVTRDPNTAKINGNIIVHNNNNNGINRPKSASAVLNAAQLTNRLMASNSTGISSGTNSLQASPQLPRLAQNASLGHLRRPRSGSDGATLIRPSHSAQVDVRSHGSSSAGSSPASSIRSNHSRHHSGYGNLQSYREHSDISNFNSNAANNTNKSSNGPFLTHSTDCKNNSVKTSSKPALIGNGISHHQLEVEVETHYSSVSDQGDLPPPPPPPSEGLASDIEENGHHHHHQTENDIDEYKNKKKNTGDVANDTQSTGLSSDNEESSVGNMKWSGMKDVYISGADNSPIKSDDSFIKSLPGVTIQIEPC